MGFGKAFQEQRMLEVWNKVDLVSQIPEGLSISCTTNQGLPQLAEVIEKKIMQIRGHKKRDIEYGLEHHSDILDWIKKNTNHTYNIEAEYNYE